MKTPNQVQSHLNKVFYKNMKTNKLAEKRFLDMVILINGHEVSPEVQETLPVTI